MMTGSNMLQRQYGWTSTRGIYSFTPWSGSGTRSTGGRPRACLYDSMKPFLNSGHAPVSIKMKMNGSNNVARINPIPKKTPGMTNQLPIIKIIRIFKGAVKAQITCLNSGAGRCKRPICFVVFTCLMLNVALLRLRSNRLNFLHLNHFQHPLSSNLTGDLGNV